MVAAINSSIEVEFIKDTLTYRLPMLAEEKGKGIWSGNEYMGLGINWQTRLANRIRNSICQRCCMLASRDCLSSRPTSWRDVNYPSNFRQRP